MPRLLRLLALAFALVLGVAACGDDDETAAPPDDDPTPEWASCENTDDGWIAEYPADWEVNDGDVVAPCSLFDPEPVEVPDAPTTLPLDIAVQLSAEDVVTPPGEEADDPLARYTDDPAAEVLDRREATVDGRDAVRVEQRRTDDGIIPEGTRSVRWVVDLDDRVVMAVSHDVGEPPFDDKVEVLDEMMERLRLDDDTDDVEEGAWEPVPDAPIAPRLNHTVTWADGLLVVWGGGDADVVQADGAAYDPDTNEWRALAATPGDRRCGASVVWTGDELIVFGGYDADGPPTPGSTHDDGVAYDPDADEWRTIASAPVTARSNAVAAWTGDEVVVVGGTDDEGGALADGAAYDPDADEWRTIAEPLLTARLGLQGAWVGDELVVFGGTAPVQDGGGDLHDTAAYDPDADEWRTAADMPGPHATAVAVAAGDVLYVVGGSDGGPEADAGPPFVAYVPDEDSWVTRPEPPATPRRHHDAAWSGSELFLWGGQTEDPGTEAVGAVWHPPR